MKRTVIVIAGVVTLGVTVWALSSGQTGSSIDPAIVATAGTPDAAVIAAPGRVEPFSEEVAIGAELSGRLLRVAVDEGDKVRSGDVLAELDSADYRARLESAVARHAAAEAAYERLVNGARGEERREAEAQRKQAEATWVQATNEDRRRRSLHRDGAIALEEAERAQRDAQAARARLDEATERAALVAADAREDDRARAQADVALARAGIEEARALLAKTMIRAPQDATVIGRHRRAGELVSPETGALFTLADTSRLRVRVEVDETDVARVALGQKVSIRADAYGDRRFSGRVSRVGLSLGRKNIHTDRPAERTDKAVLETMVDLDAGVTLPIGLRVDAFLEAGRR